MTFVEFGVRRRMVSLRMLYSTTLTKIWKGKNLTRKYFGNGESNNCRRMTRLRMLCSITFTFIFIVQHFPVMNLQQKLCNDIGCPQQIFLDSHVPRPPWSCFYLFYRSNFVTRLMGVLRWSRVTPFFRTADKHELQVCRHRLSAHGP